MCKGVAYGLDSSEVAYRYPKGMPAISQWSRMRSDRTTGIEAQRDF